MKKILFLLVLVFGFANLVFADPIVELSAPRLQTPKVIPDGGGAVTTSPAQSSAAKTKAQKVKGKKHKIKHKKHKVKPKVIQLDYNKVGKLIEYGYYDEADKVLNDTIKRNPKDIKAKSLQTVSLAKQFRLDPAQDELNVLLKQYSANSNLHYAQGIVYYQRTSSSNMYYRGNMTNLLLNAQKEFNKAVQLDKTNAGAYNALGVVAIKTGNTDAAKKYFQQALIADKTNSMAIDNLGTMDYSAGKLSDAKAKFQQALSYNSQNTTAMYHLAQVSYRQNDCLSALQYLNDALYINQNSPAIYNLMGKIYVTQGNEAAAINAFKKSIAVRPEFTLSYLDLANVYAQRGDREFAIEQLKTAVKIDPSYYDAILKIADISLANGNYKQSTDFYAQLVGVSGYNDNALKGLANAYFGQAQVASGKALLGSNKELFKALDYINKAINSNPQDLELHLAKLKLTKITNQPDQTQIELNKIVKSPNSDLMSMVVKGEAYITLNDYGNAKKTFDKAMSLSATQQDDLYLSEIFVYHKQYDSAQKMLNKILKDDPKNQEALNSVDYIQKNKKIADNYYKSAQNFLKAKNVSAAMEYLSHSVAINPDNSQAHLILAQIYEKQKDYPRAVANYKAYASLTPNSPDANKIKNKIKKLSNRL